MIARLPDCLRPRGWGEVVWKDIQYRELRVDVEDAGGEHWQCSPSVSLSGKSRKSGHMTLNIKDYAVCKFYKWRCTDGTSQDPQQKLS